MSQPSAEKENAEVAFVEELKSMLVRAHEEGLDVEQHWTCRTSGDTPDWEVEVVRLQPTEAGDDE